MNALAVFVWTLSDAVTVVVVGILALMFLASMLIGGLEKLCNWWRERK